MEHPTTLIEFMQLYPTEDACAAAILEHRWPSGFTCSRCGSKRAWFLHRRGLYECARLPLPGLADRGHDLPGQPHRPAQVVLRHLAAGLIPKGSLGRRARPPAGVTAKTAWLLRRKIQHAMSRHEGELLLAGLVELDEAFIGGKEPGSGRRGRGQPHKTPGRGGSLPDGQGWPEARPTWR